MIIESCCGDMTGLTSSLSLMMLGVTASCDLNITDLDDDGLSNFKEFAGLRIIALFETFLEAGGSITKVLCNLLLRT